MIYSRYQCVFSYNSNNHQGSENEQQQQQLVAETSKHQFYGKLRITK